MPIDALTDQPNWEPSSLGARELPSFENTTADIAPATPAVPERSTIGKLGLVLEAFGSGYRGEEPLFLKLRRQQMLEDKQRQDRDLKLQQMKLSQNNDQFDQVTKIMFSDAPAEIRESLINDMAAKGNTVAGRVKGLATKQLLGQLPGVREWMDPDIVAEVGKLRDDPNYQIKGGMSRVEADIKNAAKLRDEDTKATGDQRRFDAYTTEADAAGGVEKLPIGKQMFMLKHMQEQEKRGLELTEMREKIKLLKAPASPKAIDTEARMAEALFPGAAGFQTLEGDVTADDSVRIKSQLGYDIKPGTPKKTAIEAAMQQRDIKVAGAKAGAVEGAKLDQPEEVGKRTNIISVKALRGDNAIVHPAAGITKADMRRGDYIEISDVQMANWNKLQTAKGQAKLAFDEIRPFITAKTGPEAISQAGKLSYRGYVKGNLPEIRAFNAMKDALASIMARFVEVGVLTNTDVTRWSKTLPGVTDTKGSFDAKERVFKQLYGIASSAMKDMLLGTDVTKVSEQYGPQFNKALADAEKTVTPEQLQDDINTLLKVK